MLCLKEKLIAYATEIWQSSLALMKDGIWQYWHILQQHFQNRALHSEKSKCFIFDIFCIKHFNFSKDMSAGWIPPMRFLEVRAIQEEKNIIQSVILYSSQTQWTLIERTEHEENITLRTQFLHYYQKYQFRALWPFMEVNFHSYSVPPFEAITFVMKIFWS